MSSLFRGFPTKNASFMGTANGTGAVEKQETAASERPRRCAARSCDFQAAKFPLGSRGPPPGHRHVRSPPGGSWQSLDAMECPRCKMFLYLLCQGRPSVHIFATIRALENHLNKQDRTVTSDAFVHNGCKSYRLFPSERRAIQGFCSVSKQMRA